MFSLVLVADEAKKHLLHIINFSKIHDDVAAGTLEKQTVIDMMMKHQVQGGEHDCTIEILNSKRKQC